MYCALDQKGKAKMVERLIRAEAQQRIYKKIQQVRNRDGGPNGIQTLKISKKVPITDTEKIKALSDSNEHWETITIPKQIESLLLQRNRYHFGQAQDTPFASPPLQGDVGYKADGWAVDLILKGQAQYSTISEAAQLLVKHLQQRSTSSLEGTITPKQILGKLRKWKEETTTSPSGLHLGHYHCMWRRPTIPTGEDSGTVDTIKQYQEMLLQATADLLNYAIKFGYT